MMRQWLAIVCATAASALLAGCGGEEPVPLSASRQVVGGDPARGRAIVEAVGCGACHAIPGVQGARGIVGPALHGVGSRALLGGVVANRPAAMIVWVRNAPALAPDTGMPPMPLTSGEARDVAAFLYTLREGPAERAFPWQ